MTITIDMDTFKKQIYLCDRMAAVADKELDRDLFDGLSNLLSCMADELERNRVVEIFPSTD